MWLCVPILFSSSINGDSSFIWFVLLLQVNIHLLIVNSKLLDPSHTRSICGGFMFSSVLYEISTRTHMNISTQLNMNHINVNVHICTRDPGYIIPYRGPPKPAFTYQCFASAFVSLWVQNTGKVLLLVLAYKYWNVYEYCHMKEALVIQQNLFLFFFFLLDVCYSHFTCFVITGKICENGLSVLGNMLLFVIFLHGKYGPAEHWCASGYNIRVTQPVL